jgi:t-SNARE complex subunit (syntaxin)
METLSELEKIEKELKRIEAENKRINELHKKRVLELQLKKEALYKSAINKFSKAAQQKGKQQLSN